MKVDTQGYQLDAYETFPPKKTHKMAPKTYKMAPKAHKMAQKHEK